MTLPLIVAAVTSRKLFSYIVIGERIIGIIKECKKIRSNDNA